MKTSKPDGYLLVGACAPKAQEKLFKKLIRATGFNEKHFVPVDIRGTDNAGILERLRESVEGIFKEGNPHPILRHKERDLCCGIGRSAALPAYPRDVNVCASYLYPG